jgi:PAS domain S-box-containing protein
MDQTIQHNQNTKHSNYSKDYNLVKEKLDYLIKLVDNVSDAIISTDLGFNIISWNTAAEMIYGWKSYETIGKNIMEIIPVEYPYDDQDTVLKQFFEEEVWKGEVIQPRKDGIKINILTSVSIIKNASGKQIGAVAINRDITDRKKVERKLKESEEKLRLLVNNIQDVIIEMNDKGIVTYVSPMVYDLVGYQPEDIIGKGVIDTIHPEDIKKVRKALDNVLNSENKISVELRRLHKKGHYIYINTIAKRVNVNGQIKIIGVTRDITERKKAEEKLKESEEKFRNIAEHALMGINILQDNKVQYVNQRIADLLGYSIEEIISWSAGEFIKTIHPDDLEMVMEHVKKRQEGLKDDINHYEYRALKSNGDTIWLEVFAQQITYKGRPGDLGTVIDINERKKFEKALKRNESFLTNVFSSIEDGLCVIDTDYNIIRVNPTMEHWYSHKMPLIGTKCYNVFHKTCEKCEDCCYDDKSKLFSSKCRSRIREGPNKEILGIEEIHNYPLLNQKTCEIEGVILYLRDITDRYKTEEKLRESEEKYHSLFHSAHDVIFIHDLKGKILEVNNTAYEQFGYSIEEFKNITPWDLLASGSLSDIPMNFEGYIHLDNNYIETKFKRKDDTVIPIELSNKLIIYEGNPAILAIARDITERKKAEIIVKKELEKLRELDQIKTDFVYRSSHELRTPLNSISSAADLLMKYHYNKLDEKAARLVNIIYKGGKRLSNLIEDLMDVSRIESGMMKLKKEKINIVSIIKEAIDDLIILIAERDQSIEFNSKNDCFIEVDKDRIQQVIINILSNAIKNTPIKGNIIIGIQKKSDIVELHIKDNGVGFSEEEKKVLFKKFGKIERYGKGFDIITEGSGLGLYISKEIVDMHGGEILVESDGRNKGATFTVRLPPIN